MSNLLSSALNTDYRNVRVVKSIPKKSLETIDSLRQQLKAQMYAV